jgi:hypothetical protein
MGVEGGEVVGLSEIEFHFRYKATTAAGSG